MIKNKKTMESIIVWIVLLTVGCLFLLPFLWMVLASFDSQALSSIKIPKLTFNNYVTVMQNSDNRLSFINGIYLACGSATITTLASILAAYPLSRFPISYKYKILFGLLFLTGLPITAVMVPVYQMFVALNLQNSLTTTMIFMGASAIPYSIWLMKNFLDIVSIELEEASWVDGASRFKSLLKITIPLAFPGIAMVFISTFSGAWGNFFVPYILLQTPSRFPIALKIYQFFGQHGYVNYGMVSAFSMIYMMPSLILYIVSQRVMSLGFSMSGGNKE